MPVSGVETAPCLPALAIACLPLCLRWGDGLVCSQLALLWCLCNPLFCEWASLRLRLELFAGKYSLSLFFSLSGYPTVWVAVSRELPQIVLRAFRPGPYPKQWSLYLPVQRWRLSIWASSPLGVVVRGIFCVLFCFFPSQLCCPLRFQNSPQACQWEGFLVFGNFSVMTPFLGWVSFPYSFVSLFVSHILSYLLLKRMGCLSGCLVSSASVQKLFCRSCSAFTWSFNEFVGEKVVPPSYSSAILGPALEFCFWWSSFYQFFLLAFLLLVLYLWNSDLL